jgi:hypothetical protein
MDEALLEIREFQGNGYQPLIDFGEWRVAMLRFMEKLTLDRIDSMERHTETDEVFVLLCGKGVLFLGGCEQEVSGIYPQAMKPGIIYNVKRNAWHTILLSRDAAVLLVENRNTCENNSEFANLTPGQRRWIQENSVYEG